MICPVCFDDFVVSVGAIDDEAFTSLRTNDYLWAVEWIKGVLA